MKKIDAFLFNGEIITLLRLKYLNPVIDYFFISEKRYTYQGKRKDVLYIDLYREWFYPYIEKCKFIVDETEPDSDSWKNEGNHRSSFYTTIEETMKEEEFIGVVSDADEIPNKIVFEEEKTYKILKDGYYVFLTKEYYYNFFWHTTKIPAGTLFSDKTFSNLTKENFYLIRNWKDENNQLPKSVKIKGLIELSWHLSYFMTRDEIKRKIESFSHTECNKDEFKTNEHINNCIYKGEDLFQRHWFPPLKREDPLLQGLPEDFLQFQTLLLEKQKQ